MNNDEILKSISREQWSQLTDNGKHNYSFNIAIMDKARIDEREKVNAIQLEADKVFEKGVREHERKKTAEEIKTHLLSLMQDTSKPSFADNIKLQAYNEVLDQAIDDIEKKFIKVRP